jgi:hypothetical protein
VTRARASLYKQQVMRRPSLLRLLALLAAVAALAPTVLAGCGGEEDDPPTLLETAAAKEIESAEVQLRADADVPGFPILGSRLVLSGGGPIAAQRGSSLPELDWNLRLRAGGQAFPARLSAVDGNVYVDFMGLSYEADPEIVEQLEGAGGAGGGGGWSLEQLGIDPSDWLRQPEIEDGDDIGGDSTRVVTGTVNVRAVIDDLLAVVDLPQLSDQLAKSGEGIEGVPELDEKSLDRVEEAIRRVDVEVNVDDDDYPRRVFAEIRFRMPEDVKDTAIENGTIAFELVLEEIGDVEVNVEPPVDPRPLSSLVRFVGIVFGIDEVSDLWRTPN